MLFSELKLVLILNNLLQVWVVKVHDNEDVLNGIRGIGLDLWCDYVKDPRCEAVILYARKFSHYLNFTNKFSSLILVAKAILNQFNCDNSTAFGVASLYYLAESATANFRQDLIVFRQNGPVRIHVTHLRVISGHICFLSVISGGLLSLLTNVYGLKLVFLRFKGIHWVLLGTL